MCANETITKRGRRVQYLIALCVSLAYASIGVFTSWPAAVITKFYNNETDIKISNAEISWMVALPGIGCLFGCLLMRPMSNSLGRKFTLLASVVPTLVAVAMLVFVFKAWWICASRFTYGFSSGLSIPVISMYLGEISHKDIRGALSTLPRTMTQFGMLLTLTIGPFVSYNTLNWTLMTFPLLTLFACIWIPETPFYLLKKGRVDDARKVLAMTQGYKDTVLLEGDLMQMQAQVKHETRRSGSIKELFTGKQYRKAVIISIVLRLTCDLSGQLAIQSYIGPIVMESQYELNMATVLVMLGAVKFVFGMISLTLVDRVGRRPLFMYTYLGTAIVLVLISLYFFLLDVVQLDRDTFKPFAFIPFTGIIVSGIISHLGYFSVINIVPAELFPLNVKTVATMLYQILNGIGTFITTKTFQVLKDFLGLSGVFFVYAIIALTGAVFTFFVVPETKGQSLKEIQQMLQGELYEGGEIDTEQANLNNGSELKEIEKLITEKQKTQIDIKLL